MDNGNKGENNNGIKKMKVEGGRWKMKVEGGRMKMKEYIVN